MDTAHQPIKETSVPLEPIHRDRIAPTTLFILIIGAIFAVIYVGLFTPFGNSKLSSYIEEKLSSQLGCPVTVTEFNLTPKALTFTAIDEHDNRIQLKSRLQLFPPSMNGNYSLNFPSHMNPLETPLQSVGNITGGYHVMNLLGNATIFKGNINYNITLASLKARDAQLSIHHLDYSKLMKYLDYPHKSDTVVEGNLTIAGIDTRNIIAQGILNAKTRYFTPSPLKPDDNESTDFWELLADKNGKIRPFTIDASLDMYVNELGILEQFVSYPLRTPASAHLEMRGSQHALTTNATARIAKGDVKATLALHKLKPHKLNATLHSIDASKLFSLLSLAPPIGGKINGSITSDFTNATFDMNIKKGQTNPSVFKKHYGLTQPLIHFNADLSTQITPNTTKTNGVVTSDLGSLVIEGSPMHDVMIRELLRQILSNRQVNNQQSTEK
jgi:hypothetical protein